MRIVPPGEAVTALRRRLVGDLIGLEEDGGGGKDNLRAALLWAMWEIGGNNDAQVPAREDVIAALEMLAANEQVHYLYHREAERAIRRLGVLP